MTGVGGAGQRPRGGGGGQQSVTHILKVCLTNVRRPLGVSLHLSKVRGVTHFFQPVATQNGTRKPKRTVWVFFFFLRFSLKLLFSTQQLNAILAAEIRMSTKTNQMAKKRWERGIKVKLHKMSPTFPQRV